MTTLIPKFDLKNGGITPIGAVNRTIREKLAESISVLDFGADPTGATDSSATIQAAIDATVISGQALYIPAGVYKCGTQLNVTGNLQRIYGDGINSVLWGTHANYVLQVGLTTGGGTSYVNGVQIEDLLLWSPNGSSLNVQQCTKSIFTNIYGWSKNTVHTIQKYSILNTFNNLTASSNLIANIMAQYPILPSITNIGAGIYIYESTAGEECNACTFNSALVEGINNNGIQVTGNHTGISFYNPTVEGCTGYGYYFIGVSGQDNVQLFNAYGEANTAGAIVALNQVRMTILGGTFGGTVALSNISFSTFSTFVATSINIDVGTYPNSTDAHSASSFNIFSNLSLSSAITGTALAYAQTFQNVYTGYNATYFEYKSSTAQLYNKITLTPNNTTPDVNVGNVYGTNNSVATLYSTFGGGLKGQTITIYVLDANSTFNFSTANLKGNAGVNWVAKNGDWLTATFDGTNWYCMLGKAS